MLIIQGRSRRSVMKRMAISEHQVVWWNSLATPGPQK